ncbi:helix-turn-helix transcriptional regulator [Bosea sp. NBC_00550]|uniref:helix-turn-helix transcriptional regulator n=1 Tax=Bosea sp. NBC_00550 TaxID=2969621 RepID=UPI0022320718|nr:hypothetical protein [Bosea sp. NBC_00550]UZF94463.1 hypothetical protein NWE53_09940 [Bosea sp. NBC_00550]
MANILDNLPASIAGNRVLSTAEAAAFCRFSVAHWRRLSRSGRAPLPLRLSTRKLGWRARDLVAWIEQRATSSSGTPPGAR